MTRTSVGLAVGARQVTAVSVDPSGAVLARATTSVNGDPAAVTRSVLREVRRRSSNAPVAVAIPFEDEELSGALSAVVTKETGAVPITIREGSALVLAEAWCGAASGYRDVVAFAIGTHVTAGIMLAGSVVSGAHGLAGSVAWLALNPVERDDYRRRGGLEAEVAAPGIVRRLVWRVKSGDESQVVERVKGDLARITVDEIFVAARAGDGVCISVVRETAKYVGMAVANLASVVDPECIVLGGTLASAGDLMLDAIRTECSRRVRPAQADRLRLVLSTLGSESVAIGAARRAQLEPR